MFFGQGPQEQEVSVVQMGGIPGSQVLLPRTRQKVVLSELVRVGLPGKRKSRGIPSLVVGSRVVEVVGETLVGRVPLSSARKVDTPCPSLLCGPYSRETSTRSLSMVQCWL